MDKFPNTNQRTEPLAPKFQQWIESPIDRAAAKAQRAMQVLELLKNKFDQKEIADILIEDDECIIFLYSGKRYKAYLASDSGLYLRQW